jgi:shikimate kinase
LKKIFLIGLPGSGKSTIGKLLAKKIGLAYTDLDEVIASEMNQRISDIFADCGEPYFRELEKNQLYLQIASQKPQVISCGGGTPCFFDNMLKMNSNGITIFLDVSAIALVQRIQDNEDRPLLKNENLLDKLTRLRADRMEYYSQAQIITDGHNTPIEQVDHLIKILEDNTYSK